MEKKTRPSHRITKSAFHANSLKLPFFILFTVLYEEIQTIHPTIGCNRD
ncbi:hypothetical protein TPY_3181 [Sulfobacillus acidophilus TPY]|nr:hypothetical protein TPY_3181 [Sulfobacillus acidophilus TPY]